VSGPLHVSEAASLALHAAAILARVESEGDRESRTMPASEIAEILGASKAHLSKVLTQLTRAGILSGTTGPGGGFALARPAGEVSLLEIYEAIEGSLETERCLFDLPICEPSTCPLSRLLCDVNERIASTLADTTLREFRVPAKNG
jgi:Rrf2 family protein